MPTFYDKLFKPNMKKGITQRKRSDWSPKDRDQDDPVPIKDVENYIIRQMFKPKKKSLAKQKVHKKEAK